MAAALDPLGVHEEGVGAHGAHVDVVADDVAQVALEQGLQLHRREAQRARPVLWENYHNTSICNETS